MTARPLAGALLLLAAATARADVCESPARVGLRDLLVGAPRSPCAAREVAVRLRALALIDYPEFYGTIDAALLLGVRWPVGAVELSADARAVDWRFAQNASVTASELGMGPVAAGVLLPLSIGRVRLAPALRLVVPWTDGTMDVPAGTLEVGLHAATPLSARLVLSGSALGHGFLAASRGGAHGRGAATLSSSLAWSPWRRLRLLGGLEAQVGWYGAGLDHLLARGGAALVTAGAGRFELVVAAPLAGEERTDVAGGLDWSMPF